MVIGTTDHPTTGVSMRSRFTFLSLLTVVMASTALAATVDMNEAHRAVGRENNVRIDAQLLSEVVHSGMPIAITYQVQNLTDHAVAIAEKSSAASYDAETQTITVAIGSEIPPDGAMPRMATIAPGEKKTFQVSTSIHSTMARIGRLGPRFVQIKVNVLRNILPFRELIERQQRSPASGALPLNDQLFEQWLDGNDTIYLNTLPIRYEKNSGSSFDASSSRNVSGSR
jgi:hypothetical protein